MTDHEGWHGPLRVNAGEADDGEVEQLCSRLTVDHLPRTTPIAALAEEGASS